MSDPADFASLMRGPSPGGAVAARLRRGDSVTGQVVHIGSDGVFLDIGARTEARVDRGELLDDSGMLRVRVGDRLAARVVGTEADGQVRLSVGFGRSEKADLGDLELAQQAGLPVEGKVLQAVPAGLEVDVGGVTAFCPASLVELTYTEQLEPFVGQMLRFKVLEVKRERASVVLSRKALLLDEQAATQRRLLETLAPGAELDATVVSVQPYGVFVDLGGVQGLVHVSELAHHRVERAEDHVKIGDRLRVQVLSLEEGPKGPRLRLSAKAVLEAPEAPALPPPDQVVEAEVVEHHPRGLRIQTPHGTGFVPLRELALAHGGDHRRAHPVGSKLRVVLLRRESQAGRLTFSAAQVASVEERANFSEYSSAEVRAAARGRAVGSFGALLQAKLGLPDPQLRPDGSEEEPAPDTARSVAPVAPAEAAGARSSSAAPPRAAATSAATPPAPPRSAAEPSKAHAPARPPGGAQGNRRRALPTGVERRRKPAAG